MSSISPLPFLLNQTPKNSLGYLATLLSSNPPKRKVFVSYDHDDTEQVNGFLGLRYLDLGVDFINHKLDHTIGGQSDEYKRRIIREQHIRPASVTVVLIGVNYWMGKWSNWEIEDSVSEGNGLLAIALKGVGQATLPSEFQKYYSAGLVRFVSWAPQTFSQFINEANQNRGRLQQHKATIDAAQLFLGKKTLLGGF